MVIKTEELKQLLNRLFCLYLFSFTYNLKFTKPLYFFCEISVNQYEKIDNNYSAFIQNFVVKLGQSVDSCGVAVVHAVVVVTGAYHYVPACVTLHHGGTWMLTHHVLRKGWTSRAYVTHDQDLQQRGKQFWKEAVEIS